MEGHGFHQLCLLKACVFPWCYKKKKPQGVCDCVFSICAHTLHCTCLRHSARTHAFARWMNYVTTFKLNAVQLFSPFQPLLVYVLYTCLLPICCKEKKNSELFIVRSLTPKHESSLRTGGVKVRPMSSSPHKIKQIKGWIGGGGSTAGLKAQRAATSEST